MENSLFFRRYEYKYRLTIAQYEGILAGIKEYMQPDAFSHSQIRNLYCDTSNFRLARASLEQPMYKEKLRLRSYGPAGPGDEIFIELKKKYDSVVYKRRLSLPQARALDTLAGRARLPGCQVGREVEAALEYYGSLQPRVFLSYERDSYCARDGSPFRLTFDREIRYRTEALTLDGPCEGIPLLPEDRVLMELKIPDAVPLWMARLLSGQGIQKISFSKYGSAYRSILQANARSESCSPWIV